MLSQRAGAKRKKGPPQRAPGVRTARGHLLLRPALPLHQVFHASLQAQKAKNRGWAGACTGSTTRKPRANACTQRTLPRHPRSTKCTHRPASRTPPPTHASIAASPGGSAWARRRHGRDLGEGSWAGSRGPAAPRPERPRDTYFPDAPLEEGFGREHPLPHRRELHVDSPLPPSAASRSRKAAASARQPIILRADVSAAPPPARARPAAPPARGARPTCSNDVAGAERPGPAARRAHWPRSGPRLAASLPRVAT